MIHPRMTGSLLYILTETLTMAQKTVGPYIVLLGSFGIVLFILFIFMIFILHYTLMIILFLLFFIYYIHVKYFNPLHSVSIY